jgi:hypothetical protein
MGKFLWTQRSDFGPGQRTSHAMTFDSQRGRTVLFGGNSGDAVLGDTWEWDGSFWTQMDNSGPGPRTEHAMVYDSVRQVSILFGGRGPADPADSPNLGDTWQWDGQDWTNLQTPARFHAPSMEWRSTAAEIGPCYLEAWRGTSRTSWIPGSSTARNGRNRQTPDRRRLQRVPTGVNRDSQGPPMERV